MINKEILTTQELISCEICLKEVSAIESKLSEVDDYVLHFCGIECYDQWHNSSENPPEIN